MVATEAGADQDGGMVEIAGREGMTDRRVKVAGLLVPSRRSTVQLRGRSRLTRLELVLQELPQQRVIAVRPAVLVDQDGGPRQVGEQRRPSRSWPATASQTGPPSRSRIDVRVRKSMSRAERCWSTSDRR